MQFAKQIEFCCTILLKQIPRLMTKGVVGWPTFVFQNKMARITIHETIYCLGELNLVYLSPSQEQYQNYGFVKSGGENNRV